MFLKQSSLNFYEKIGKFGSDWSNFLPMKASRENLMSNSESWVPITYSKVPSVCRKYANKWNRNPDRGSSSFKLTLTLKMLQNNGPCHAHRDVVDYLTEEGIEIIPHLPYSPDLAPCDF